MNPIKGHRLIVSFEGRDNIEAVVIDPEGIVSNGVGSPSLGFSLNMMEKHLGISHQVLSKWILKGGGNASDKKTLKLPSGKCFTLATIPDKDGNIQYLTRIEDAVDIASDLIMNPGRLTRETVFSLVRFLAWFAIKGFYASAYVQNGIAYTAPVDAGIESQIIAVRAENEELKARLAGLEQNLSDAIAFNQNLSDLLDKTECEKFQAEEFAWQEGSLRNAEREYSKFLETRIDYLQN